MTLRLLPVVRVAIGIGSLLVVPSRSTAQARTSRFAVISVDRAKLSGVSLDLTRPAVRRILGNPSRRSKPEFDELIGDSVQTWTYPLGDFVFFGAKLSEVTCRAAACVTPDGVRVGDLQARVGAVYGKDADDPPILDRTIFYAIGESDCWLSFVIKKGVVAEIRMACDYS